MGGLNSNVYETGGLGFVEAENPGQRDGREADPHRRLAPFIWLYPNKKPGAARLEGTSLIDSTGRPTHTMPLGKDKRKLIAGPLPQPAQCAFPLLTTVSTKQNCKHSTSETTGSPKAAGPPQPLPPDQGSVRVLFLSPGFCQSFLCGVIFSSVGQIKLWSLIVTLGCNHTLLCIVTEVFIYAIYFVSWNTPNPLSIASCLSS